MELIRLSRDFMFTSIFNQEKNVSKLERFISVYFNIDYDKVHNNLKLIPRKLPKNKLKEAYKEVDLVLELENSLLRINFEINSDITPNKIIRNTIYICKISSFNLEEGDNNYSKIWFSRQINFNIKSKGRKLINEYVFKEKDDNDILTDVVQIDVINMAIIDELCYNDLTEKEKMVYNFCKLLQATDEKEFKRISEVIMKKEESQDLVKQVRDMSSLSDYIYMNSTYASEEEERADVLRVAQEEGRAEGLAEGINQRNIDIAKNMLKDNMSLEMISKYTGLSIDEINDLKEV